MSLRPSSLKSAATIAVAPRLASLDEPFLAASPGEHASSSRAPEPLRAISLPKKAVVNGASTNTSGSRKRSESDDCAAFCRNNRTRTPLAVDEAKRRSSRPSSSQSMTSTTSAVRCHESSAVRIGEPLGISTVPNVGTSSAVRLPQIFNKVCAC